MLRRLGRWLARDDIRQLTEVIARRDSALAKAQADNLWMARRLAEMYQGCPERPLCVQQAIELERLTTEARSET